MIKKNINKKRVVVIKPPKKWFEEKILATDFSKFVGSDGKYYGQHNAWKKHIFIGPYETLKDLESIIKKYVKISETPYNKRYVNIMSALKVMEVVHSYIHEADSSFFKEI